MAMGYDGVIRIDSRVDVKNFNSAITRMINVVKKLGVALVGVLGVRAMGRLVKDAVSSASELSSALTGLQSIVEGSGQSFAHAQKFIDEYISDGLVPATNAINAYKNLALRGYNTDQIEKTLEILKNTAVFGRQASLSVGEAVQSASEGLKNENSILVDNAGVTKNVSKMWDTFAKSIGTTANALTQDQKIQAEVNGLIEESRLQMGDAAKYIDTYAGKVSQLSYAFQNLKIAIGNIFIPILKKLIPIIIETINYFTILANKIGRFIQIFFGIEVSAEELESFANGASAAAEAQGDLADATEEAGKAAKGALAPFDELNVLAQDTGGAGAPEVPGVGETPGGEVPGGGVIDETIAKIEALKARLAELFAPTIESLGRLKDALEPLKTFAATGLEDFYNNFLVPVGTWVMGEGLPRFIDAITEGLEKVDWENINDSLNNLWDSLAPFAINVGEGLLWLWENVLVPFGTWVLNDAVPVFLDLLSGAIDVLNSIIEALKPLGIWLWEEFLQPAGEWVGQALLDALGWLTEKLSDLSTWIDEHQTAVETIAIVIGSVAAAILLVNIALEAYNIAMGIAAVLTGFTVTPIMLVIAAVAALIIIIVLLARNWESVWAWIKQAWENITDWAADALNKIGEFFANLWEGIKEIWSKVKDWFIEKVWTPLTDWAANTLNSIGEFFTGLWEDIKGVWGTVVDWFQTTIINPVKNAFKTMLDWLGNKWETVFGGIKDFVKNIINGIIGFINGMISAVAGGINAVVGAMNSINVTIPDWVPVFGGRHFGLSIPTVSAPQIPLLATGAVIPPNSQFAAILGDQRSGYNLEGPEDMFRQIIREELADMIGGGEDINVTMPVYLDSEKIYEGQKRVQRRRGNSLVVEGGAA